MKLLTCNFMQPSVTCLHLLKKIKLSLCLTKYHSIKTYWIMEVRLHAFLISALDGGEWSASPLGPKCGVDAVKQAT
jgi:hypothetical protein